MNSNNLFALPHIHTDNEYFETLVSAPDVRIERIISHGQATPAGEWYDQDRDEWVLLLKGSAALLFEGESESRALSVGDYLLIPAHVRHRVEWTAPGKTTIWLAVHMQSLDNTAL